MACVELFDYDTILNGTSFVRVEFVDFINKVRSDSSFPTQKVITLFFLIYSTVGCIGNLLICYVIISFKHMLTTVNMYLFSLAVSDCLMLVSFTFAALRSIHYGSTLYLFKLDLGFVLASLCHVTGTSASILVTVVITVDRYIAVCHPFIGHKLFNRPRTAKIILTLWTVSFLHASAFALCTDYFMSRWCDSLRIVVSVEFLSLIHFVFPLSTIIVLYTLIGFNIWRSYILRKSSCCSRNVNTGGRSLRRQLNMSVAVVVEFIICWGPLNLAILLFKYKPFDRLHTGRTAIFILGISLYLLSTVVNPVIYFVMSSKFRKAIKTLLCVNENRCTLPSTIRFRSST